MFSMGKIDGVYVLYTQVVEVAGLSRFTNLHNKKVD